jgi:hypothetical protein
MQTYIEVHFLVALFGSVGSKTTFVRLRTSRPTSNAWDVPHAYLQLQDVTEGK